MALEDSLSRVPGLAGYLGRQQFDREQSLAGLQQATAATTLAANLKAQQESAQIKEVLAGSPDLATAIPKLAALGPNGIAVATHLAALDKAKKSNELMSQAMAGGGTGGLNDPDTIDRIAQAHFAAGDHVNAAAAMTLADKRRAQLRDATALSGMNSAPAVPAIAPDVQETQQAMDQGTTMPGPSAAQPARPGGVPDYLLQSPHVGSSAKALQTRIDAGMVPTGAAAEKLIENLGKSHDAMVQAKALLGQRGQQASDLLDQRGEQKLNVTGGRESVYIQRMMMGANQASKDLANVVQLPLTASTGIFGGRKQGPGLFDAGKEVLANKATGQDAQAYNAMATGFQRSLAQIESAGLMPSGSLTHQMDAVLFKEGDTNLTKLHKLAQTRQIVEAGMEVVDANPRVSPEEKAKVKTVLESIRKSVPFTHSDLIQLQEAQRTDPNATLGSIIKNKSSGWSIRPK